MTLYHYTSAGALRAILEENRLKPSLKGTRSRDVLYGEGQYLERVTRICWQNPMPEKELIELSPALAVVPLSKAEFQEIWQSAIVSKAA